MEQEEIQHKLNQIESLLGEIEEATDINVGLVRMELTSLEIEISKKLK